MTDDTNNVRDLLQRSAGDRGLDSVQERVHRRKEILRTWLRDGVPQEALSSLPTSLRQARDWHDERIGIFKIGSPNDFTTKHETWGRDVREIARLLTQLRERYKQPTRRRRPSTAPQDAPRDQGENQRELVLAVSQWHAARSAHHAEKARADALESRIASLTNEAQKLHQELAEMRQQLAAANLGLRAVK